MKCYINDDAYSLTDNINFSDADTWLEFLETLESSNEVFEVMKELIEQRLVKVDNAGHEVDPEQAISNLQNKIDCNNAVIEFVSGKLAE